MLRSICSVSVDKERTRWSSSEVVCVAKLVTLCLVELLTTLRREDVVGGRAGLS